MARAFNTDHTFNIEDERWQPLLDWLEQDGRRITDCALEKGLYDTAYGFDNHSIETNFLLLDDAQMREINRDCRGKNAPTNVLSFPQFDTLDELHKTLTHYSDIDDGPKKPLLLGDIVLSYDTIVREASEESITMRDHLGHMLVHGILHLLGYDHQLEAEAEAMERLECDILHAFGIESPYIRHKPMAY